MKRGTADDATVSVEFHAPSVSERCVGVVIRREPLHVLLPVHAAGVLENDAEMRSRVNGVAYGDVRPVPNAHLAASHLVLVWFAEPDGAVGPLQRIRAIPARALPVQPGSR